MIMFAKLPKQTPAMLFNDLTEFYEFLKALLKDYWHVLAFVAGAFWLLIRKIKKNSPAFSAFFNTVSLLNALEKAVNIRLEEVIENQHYLLGRLNLQTDISTVATFRANAKGHCIYVNDAYCKMFGKSEDELLGDGWFSVVAEHNLDKTLRLWQNAINTQAQTFIEFDAKTTDGIKRVKAFCFVIYNKKNEFVEFYGHAYLVNEN
jgi:PAS domain S-box-containing protein